MFLRTAEVSFGPDSLYLLETKGLFYLMKICGSKVCFTNFYKSKVRHYNILLPSIMKSNVDYEPVFVFFFGDASRILQALMTLEIQMKESV